jgi:hypothetical protein
MMDEELEGFRRGFHQQIKHGNKYANKMQCNLISSKFKGK